MAGWLGARLWSLAAAPDAPPATDAFAPDWTSLRRYHCPEWFRDAKLGIWACWGPESVPQQGDWYARNLYLPGQPQYEHHLRTYGHPSQSGYKDLIPLWKGERWNPDRLMALYQKAGAKYFCVIANHHDNFDCWNSKFHRWNSVNMGPHRDIVGEWKKAADKYGLRFGVTEHLGASWGWYSVSKGADTNGPLAGVPYDGADPRYADLYWSGNEHPDGWYAKNAPESFKQIWFNRITDLVDSCHPDLLYSDGSLPFGDYGRRLLAHFYNDNRQRHGGRLEAVYTWKNNRDGGEFVDGAAVEDLERGVRDAIKPQPWQTDTCVGDWYYKAALRYKTTETVLQMLVDIVSKNGNLLLNLPLRPDGTLDAEEENILAGLAAWMRVNGEAIFGTRPWQVYGEGPARVAGGGFNEGSLRYTAADVRFTTKGNALYAFSLGWPADGRVTIRSLASFPGQGRVRRVALLGHRGALAWRPTADGLQITLPATKPCDYTCAFRILGDRLQPAPIVAAAIRPQADGRIVLRANDATIHGASPRYEVGGGKDNIGYWGDPNDFVSWKLQVPRPGNYTVEVVYSCDAGVAGSEFTVELAGQQVRGRSRSTGSWAVFTKENLGALKLDQPGRCTLAVRPRPEPPWKVIGLQSVTLAPLAP